MAGREKRVRRAKMPSGDRRSAAASTIHHPSSIINAPAFTLIELLVVISIVVLLMAVLLPTLGRVRRQAGAIGCQSNLRQSGFYFAAYANEHNGQFHPGWDGTSWNHLNYELVFPILAGPSMEHKDLLLCPMASRPNDVPDLTAAEPVGKRGGTFSAWAWVRRGAMGDLVIIPGSYGINILVQTQTAPDRVSWAKALQRTTDVREASCIPFYLDCMCATLLASGPDDEPPP